LNTGKSEMAQIKESITAFSARAGVILLLYMNFSIK